MLNGGIANTIGVATYSFRNISVYSGRHKNCTKPLCTKYSYVNLMTYRTAMLLVATWSTNKHPLRVTIKKIRTRILQKDTNNIETSV